MDFAFFPNQILVLIHIIIRNVRISISQPVDQLLICKRCAYVSGMPAVPPDLYPLPDNLLYASTPAATEAFKRVNIALLIGMGGHEITLFADKPATPSLISNDKANRSCGRSS